MQINLNIEDLHFDTPLPQLYHVRKPAPATPPLDVASAVRIQLDKLGLAKRIRPGMSVAVTAGSRGIHDIVPALQGAVAYLKDAGAQPFVIPAMGSHGGATAQGQIGVLRDLHVTEETIGCPIRATMDVVEVGRLPNGIPAYLDRYAAEADGILALNRVKPHTDFHGPIESGVAKIIAIGLGKRRGAVTVHSHGPAGLRDLIPPLARLVVNTGKVLCGVALLEDASERTAEVVALPPEEIGAAGEQALLKRAFTLMGRLPFEQLHVLIVDEFGKNISGAGLDNNVLGRMRIPGEAEPDAPRINIVVALDITAPSHGNATGMSLADIVTARVAQKIDFATTYINGLTSGLGAIQRIALPAVLPTSRDAVGAALHCCAHPDVETVRMARIHNTLSVQDMLVTAPLLEEAQTAGFELLGKATWELE
ncbi:MAG TPA: lactate racemase domain-containing protein [Roseiflexaceae bacterium]|nr:lactate racemase domain-containing protein [Roseiflexaceae bacterium]